MADPQRRSLSDCDGLGLREEWFETLSEGRGSWQLERIVSRGQVTAEGQWYDQNQEEWVLVVTGTADLTLIDAGQATTWRLVPGDLVRLPAGCRHRVDRTDDPVVWLALHLWAEDPSG